METDEKRDAEYEREKEAYERELAREHELAGHWRGMVEWVRGDGREQSDGDDS